MCTMSLPTLEQLCTLEYQAAVAVLFAFFWAFTVDPYENKISNTLSNAAWWPRAFSPTKSMMCNFGYPTEPNKRFPDGVTDQLAKDFYANTISICTAHAICASPMLPVLIYGWEESSELMKLSFVLATLTDLGYDIYDFFRLALRTFASNHPKPTPIEFFAILGVMHHTTGLALIMPLNMYYVDRFEYHQTAVSLLAAAALCFIAGAYKFTLDVYEKKKDFVLYKGIVLFQLAIILYTRVYLWFPASLGLRAYMKEQNDITFFQCATVSKWRDYAL